jgi:hypothetical protein
MRTPGSPLKERIANALILSGKKVVPSRDVAVTRGTHCRSRRLRLVVADATVVVALGVGLLLAIVNVAQPSLASARATSSTSTSAVAAGIFAGSYRFHVNTITIAANGAGAASWRATYGTSYKIARAAFRLTSVRDRTATGIVEKSTYSREWKPRQVFRLVLRPNDMLVLAPSGPFDPLCGTVAQREWRTGKAPAGVNCGA